MGLSSPHQGGEGRDGDREMRAVGTCLLVLARGWRPLITALHPSDRGCVPQWWGTDSRTQISEAVPEAWLNLHRRWADLGKTRKGTKCVSNGRRFSGSAALPGTQFRDFTWLSLCALKTDREKGSERESKENQRSKCVAPRDKSLKVESQVKL